LKTCVVIPGYNVADTIGKLVAAITARGLDVVIVDDGSKDDTAKTAKLAGATVISHARNRGKGNSIIDGIRYARSKNYAAVIFMDGDGQHDPRDLDKFLQSAKAQTAMIFTGNRLRKSKGMPLLRWLTNKIMSGLISALSGQKIPDTQCGYRLVKKEVLERVSLSSRNYEIESELLLKAARAGFKISSVPIRNIYAGQSSRINPFIDTLRFFKMVFRFLFFSR
jgi:glycosyltransferase involved in cell wall biosynthesis